MKKINKFIILFILIITVSSCAGYEPIFNISKIQFEIAEYSIQGNKKLGKSIYSKLNNLSKAYKDNSDKKSLNLLIKVLKEKKATAKDSAGKTLEYRIKLSTHVVAEDYLTGKKILDHNFTYSLSYKVQDQYSQTIDFENKTIINLMERTYQELLVKLSEAIK